MTIGDIGKPSTFLGSFHPLGAFDLMTSDVFFNFNVVLSLALDIHVF